VVVRGISGLERGIIRFAEILQNNASNFTIPIKLNKISHIITITMIINIIFTQAEHTILLVQPMNKLETRTYSDFETINECMEGKKYNYIGCKIFKEFLSFFPSNFILLTEI